MRFFFLFFIALLFAISITTAQEETAGRIIEDNESDKFLNGEIINVESVPSEAEVDEIQEVSVASQVS
jgi:hypothetical protein